VSGVRSNVEGDAENLGREIALCVVESDVANEPCYPGQTEWTTRQVSTPDRALART
jgi:hypothetical protein